MNCPKCGGNMVSDGIDAYRLFWRCTSCSYQTSTRKPKRKREKL